MPAWLPLVCDITEAVAYCFMLLPAIAAYCQREKLSKGLKTLAYIPVYLFCTFIAGRIATALFNYNLLILHLSVIGETLLYLKVYHDEFSNKRVKKYIKYTAVLFILFALIDSFVIEGFYKINALTNLLESLIIITLGLLYFEKYLHSNRYNSKNTPLFIGTSGIILYLSGTIVMYLMTNHFIIENDEYGARLMYLINSLLILSLSIVFFCVFWKNKNINYNIQQV